MLTEEIVPSDLAILDLLRQEQAMSVPELARRMRVTATAVRQRLVRLMSQGFVDRTAVKVGRGRPSHRYVLTDKGRRKAGANFDDLAIAAWEEIRQIDDPEIRHHLIRRISRRLVHRYAERIQGETLEQKMHALVALFSERRIPYVVEDGNGLPVLRALACPYPGLADENRTICSMERTLFSELLGESVHLGECRLDGAEHCKFEVDRKEDLAALAESAAPGP